MKRILLTTLAGVAILLCGTGLFALGYYYRKPMETETTPLGDADTEPELDYESTSLRPNCSFIVSDHGEITFKPSNNHVIDHVVGSAPSRITTAHPYEDRILIEFQRTAEAGSGLCTVVRASRTGYREAGE
ncbi:MAG: hypothetical protein QGH60_24710, partial [Phycisphaerae bacterium]|nr:hypothetical protein [Phycisphaerae bacterium]